MVVKAEHYRQVNKAKKHPERNETTYKTTIRLMKVLIATGENRKTRGAISMLWEKVSKLSLKSDSKLHTILRNEAEILKEKWNYMIFMKNLPNIYFRKKDV